MHLKKKQKKKQQQQIFYFFLFLFQRNPVGRAVLPCVSARLDFQSWGMCVSHLPYVALLDYFRSFSLRKTYFTCDEAEIFTLRFGYIQYISLYIDDLRQSTELPCVLAVCRPMFSFLSLFLSFFFFQRGKEISVSAFLPKKKKTQLARLAAVFLAKQNASPRRDLHLSLFFLSLEAAMRVYGPMIFC